MATSSITPNPERRGLVAALLIAALLVVLGWRAEHTWEQGIAETVRWYEANREWWGRVTSEAYRAAVEREVTEEVNIETGHSDRVVALLNDDSNEVGQVHLVARHLEAGELTRPGGLERLGELREELAPGNDQAVEGAHRDEALDRQALQAGAPAELGQGGVRAVCRGRVEPGQRGVAEAPGIAVAQTHAEGQTLRCAQAKL